MFSILTFYIHFFEYICSVLYNLFHLKYLLFPVDIFLEMRGTMQHSKWEELFEGLQMAIWEYCAYLFDGNERLVNEATVRILMELVQNSTSGRKAINKEEMTMAEKRVNEQVRQLLKQKYRG